MKATSLSLMVTVMMSAGVCAQSMIEHAAAVAGATAGSAGGKALSNMIDKTLNKAAESASETAKTPQPEQKAQPNASVTPAGTSEPLPSSAAPARLPHGTRQARSVRAAAAAPAPVAEKPVFAVEQPNLPAPVAAMAPAPPTAEDFAKVKEGSAREEVFAALGTPSSHITIPDEGHLIEIMSYSDGGRRIGSVRLDNGVVVSVSAAK